jgi:hypothetical protein
MSGFVGGLSQGMSPMLQSMMYAQALRNMNMNPSAIDPTTGAPYGAAGRINPTGTPDNTPQPTYMPNAPPPPIPGLGARLFGQTAPQPQLVPQAAASTAPGVPGAVTVPQQPPGPGYFQNLFSPGSTLPPPPSVMPPPMGTGAVGGNLPMGGPPGTLPSQPPAQPQRPMFTPPIPPPLQPIPGGPGATPSAGPPPPLGTGTTQGHPPVRRSPMWTLGQMNMRGSPWSANYGV